MLELEDLCVYHSDGREAVHHLSLRTGHGRTALIGANGAGKSSLLLACEGFLRTSGSLVVDGVRLCPENLRQIRAGTGLVFQDPDDQLFLPTVRENLSLAAEQAGAGSEDMHRLLHTFQLEDVLNETVLTLSGGQKRLTALAQVLLRRPATVFLDEPTAFLDPRARRQLISLLNAAGGDYLIATHDLHFALAVCETAVIIHQGALIACGKTAALVYDQELMARAGLESADKW